MKKKLLLLFATMIVALTSLATSAFAFEVNTDKYDTYKRRATGDAHGIEVDELLYAGIIKENAEYMIRFYNENYNPVNIELYKELKNVGTTQYYAYSIKPNTTVNLVTWDQNPNSKNTLFMLEKSRDPDNYGSYYNVRSVAHPQYYLAMGRYNLTYSGGPYEFQIAKDKSYNSYYPSFYVKEKHTNFSYVYHLGLVDNSFEFKTNRPSEGSAEYRQYQAKLAKIFENVAVRKETVCCYDGNVHLPETPIGVNDGTVEYSMTGTDGTWTSAPTSAGGFPVNAGEYTVYMKIMSSTTDPSPCKDLIVSAKVRIENTPVVSDSPEAVNPTFTVDDSGNPIAYELVTAGTADGGEMRYSLDNRTWSASIPKATVAGEYTVYYKAVGTGAQAGSESAVASVTATMQKREVEVPSVATYSCEYNGQLQTLPNENIRDFDSKYVEVLRGHTGTDSRKYSVYFGIKYKDSTVWHGSTDSEDRYRSQVWEITKRAVTVTGLSAVDRDYEYDNRTVEITGTPVLNDVLECDEGQVDIDTTSIPTTGTVSTTYAGNGKTVTCANNITLTGDKAKNYTLTQPTLTVNILKASATINNPPTAIEELVYDGSGHELVTAASSGDATGGKINYSLDQENWSTTVPKGTATGEYTVYYKASASNSNYKDSEVQSVKVTIAQAEVNEPTVSGSYTYNGQNQTVTLDGYDSSYMSVTGDTEKNAGSHTVNVTLDSNHKWAESSDGSIEWSIAPKAVTVTIDVKSSAYCEDIAELTATDNGIIDGETGVYTLSTTATASSPAGQYDITGESNSANYTFTFENGINAYTIVPANLSGVTVSLDGWTYGSAPNTPVVTGNAENANVSYQYKVQGTDDTTYSDAVPTGVGNYTVKATIAETNNYNAATATADFTISKATPTVTAPTANTLTYTGEPQELIKAGSTKGGTLQYSTSQDGEYTTSIPTGTDVKDYTVYYKVVGDSNYNDVEPESVNITIAKATPTVTAPTAKTLTYTGEAQALVSVGATTGGTIQYSLDNSTWSAEIPTATDAKEYKVYYKVVGDDNHNDVEPTSITVTIAALAENTPSIAVNYADETLTGFDTDSSYAIGGADVAPTNGTLAAESYIGSEISIVKKASDTNHADSAAQTLTIKPRPTAPTGISATKASDNDTADGTITNVDSTMEYKASDADAWLSVTDTQITGLAAGDYKVRYKATQTEFASAAADVNIGVIGIYTITFVNYDNEVLQAINVAVGSMPQYSGEEPIKPNDDKYTYSFAGWEPSVTAVTENATYTAKFDSTPRVYNVTLEANGGAVENADNYKTYSYGTGLILPTPTRDNYYFGGWYDNENLAGTAVTAVTAEDTGDKTYYAKWMEEEPTEYLITFVNYDNTELQSGMVSVGTLPVYSGETPTKPNDDKYSYTFTGWSSEITEVTGIAVYAAQFERTPIAYNVELTNEGKAVVLAPEAVTDYVLIFAAYDANGMMTGIELKYITFDEAGEKEFEPETLETNGAAKIKVMLWDDVSNMTPKCGSDSMNLQ